MVWSLGSTLAQAESAGGSIIELLPRLGVVLVIAVVLVVAVSVIRRKVRDIDDGAPRDFSLGDLRRLQAEGKITQDELNRAKAALVGRAKASVEEPPKEKPYERGAELK